MCVITLDFLKIKIINSAFFGYLATSTFTYYEFKSLIEPKFKRNLEYLKIT